MKFGCKTVYLPFPAYLQSFPLGGILGKLLINKLFFLGGLFQGLQKI